MTFSPFGWEVLPFFGPLVPSALLEYAIWHGHRPLGILGLILWLPLVWILLVEIHHMGRVRIWLSAPIILVAHVVMTLAFAGLVPGLTL